MLNSSKLLAGIRIFLGLLLLWAAVSKLANPADFLGSVYAYDLPLPRGLLKFAAVVLPWAELLCGLLLLANFWTESALAAAGILMLLFVAATGQAWMRGLEISCGCFNLKIFNWHETRPQLVHFLESPAFAFFRNLVLSALVLLVFWKRVRQPADVQPAR